MTEWTQIAIVGNGDLRTGQWRLLFEKPGALKGRLGVGARADLARGRCVTALHGVVVSAIPCGSGPGLRA
jgi:hypothetical protein